MRPSYSRRSLTRLFPPPFHTVKIHPHFDHPSRVPSVRSAMEITVLEHQAPTCVDVVQVSSKLMHGEDPGEARGDSAAKEEYFCKVATTKQSRRHGDIID